MFRYVFQRVDPRCPFFSCLEMFRNILPLHCFYVDSQEGMTDAQQTYVASVGNEIYRRAGYLA